MWFKITFISILVFISTTGLVIGQTIPDTIVTKELYENIEKKSGKSKLTKLIHGMLFKPVAPGVKKKKTYKKLIEKPFSTFKGKVIRNIKITTLDPFGYLISDTNAAPHSFITRAGNTLHIQSRPGTIRNMLLFRENQIFDSLLVKESERFVRSQKYVRDVSFFVISTSKDSVDVWIRVLDSWSLIPRGAINTTKVALSINERNFLGLGHDTQDGFVWNHKTGEFDYTLNYFIPNIRNTFINSTIHYGSFEYEDLIKSIAVDRPFFSPLTKWAAGIKFSQVFREVYIPASDSVLFLQRFKYNSQDFWAGYSMNVFKGRSVDDRTTNLITAGRFLRVRYLEKPIEEYDVQHTFADEEFYLGSIGISTRNYVQDQYIFRFGVPEDIPIGKVISLTGGYQDRYNTSSRLYAGTRVAFGYYYPWGYLSANFEYGSFFRASQQEQAVLSANVIYFTGLVEIRKWKFRQFVKPQILIGLNRFAYDSLTLNEGYGLDGFRSNELKGTSRFLFSIQTQSYAPYEWIGFRFGPFINCTLGILSDEVTGFADRKVYAQIGLGVIIKNDYLVFNTFQLSVSFYPVMPGGEPGSFKFNSYRTNEFGFVDFDVGKPGTVFYR